MSHLNSLALLALKVLLPSLIISWGIKFLVPAFAPPAELPWVLLLVFAPVLAIALWLGLQEWQGRKMP
ncbi:MULTISPECIES: hypothetical protein [unclassified Synechocystis]|uniref:hypothetical protein n=1 Tax=unclassified Synechocystis TaxID=2640012 RepID=UPI00041F17B0|nr:MULTISPECIES: hypothetical protein [unclassified Synechocystis]AIE73966.1 hypothetical protein D082_14380 [Synechocystis sp. PCC 6714]MCT0252529.1 hypothetical protein [Synechocystis sp. CS-94]